QPRGAVAQHVGVVDLLALELRHGDRIALGRRGLAVAQQLAGVLAVGIGATEKLAEAAGLELHLAAALVALQARPLVALDAELAVLDLVCRPVLALTEAVQPAGLAPQRGVPGRAPLGR